MSTVQRSQFNEENNPCQFLVISTFCVSIMVFSESAKQQQCGEKKNETNVKNQIAWNTSAFSVRFQCNFHEMNQYSSVGRSRIDSFGNIYTFIFFF